VMLDRARANGHAVMRCDDSTPVGAIRTEIRRLARTEQVSIRTGMVDDVLAVVPADADLWRQPVARMRTELRAPTAANVVR
jgi:hypothetical protein